MTRKTFGHENGSDFLAEGNVRSAGAHHQEQKQRGNHVSHGFCVTPDAARAKRIHAAPSAIWQTNGVISMPVRSLYCPAIVSLKLFSPSRCTRLIVAPPKP